MFMQPHRSSHLMEKYTETVMKKLVPTVQCAQGMVKFFSKVLPLGVCRKQQLNFSVTK